MAFRMAAAYGHLSFTSFTQFKNLRINVNADNDFAFRRWLLMDILPKTSLKFRFEV